jgi:TonB-linked SusC/RagA family outer membrane protein
MKPVTVRKAMWLWLVMVIVGFRVFTAQAAEIVPQIRVTKPDVSNCLINCQEKNKPAYHIFSSFLKETSLYHSFPYNGKNISIKLRINKTVDQQSTIAGSVTDAQTGDPLPGVNILVIGTSNGTSTNADGHYSLQVENQNDTLRFSYIGYETKKVPIKGRTNIDVKLSNKTTNLNQLVVVGIGVETQKKKLGNSVATISTNDLKNEAISSSIDILSGRITGVQTQPSSGQVGEGATIRIRGSSSLALSNDPLVYVDGVRMHSEHHGGGGSIRGSRMNDINPADIKNIQVLKGASAATLYGSEANNGIINITTKTGQAGKPSFNFITSQGVARTPRNYSGNYVYDPKTNKILYLNALDKNLENSYRQKYSLSASGGSDDATYYTSAFFNNSNGVVPDVKYQQFGARSNIRVYPIDKVTVGLNLAYIKTFRNENPIGGHPSAFAANMMLGNPLLVSEDRPNGEIFVPKHQILREDSKTHVGDLIVSGHINVDWTKGFNTKFVFGYNNTRNDYNEIWPLGQTYYPKGRIIVYNRKHHNWSVNLIANWKKNISEKVKSTLYVGGQVFLSSETFVNDEVGDLAGEGIPVLRGGASIFTVDEYIEELKNAGYYAQEQLGFWNKLYITGGVRFDASSAFGSNIKTDIYPKVGFSYLLPTDFANFLSSLRLRGSFGVSGLQPEAFASQRTYTPTRYLDGVPGFLPGNLGNKDLKPERSKAIEIGLNAGFLNERLTLSLTYFNQKTDDALFPKQFPPSAGFVNPQLVNIGRLSNKGLELELKLKVLENEESSGFIKAMISTLDEKVDDLGGAPPQKVGNNEDTFRAINTIKEGYQPGAFIGDIVDSEDPYSFAVPINEVNDIDEISANTLENNNGNKVQRFLGNVLPTLTGSLFFNFSIKKFAITAALSGASGLSIFDANDLIRSQLGLTKEIAEIQKKLKDPTTSNEQKKELAMEYAYVDFNVNGNWIKPADYIRLKEVTFGYRVPIGKHNNGISRLRFDLSFKNLFTLTNYTGYGSPGTSSTSLSNGFNRSQDRFGLPIPRQILLKMELKF